MRLRTSFLAAFILLFECFALAQTVTTNDGYVRFNTPSYDMSGSTGIIANPNGWTQINPNGSRFVIPVPLSRVQSQDNVLDIEDTSTWTHRFELHADGGAFFLGNVGIGTATPSSQFTVNFSGMYDSSTRRYVDIVGDFYGSNPASSSNAGAFTGIRLGNLNVGKYGIIGAVSEDPLGWSRQTGLSFWTAAHDSMPAERVRISASGNVGIGTTSPSQKLEIAGNAKINGSLYFADGSIQSTAWNGSLCGGDYAESVDVANERKDYEPGDVLVIAEDGRNFAKSAEPYSTGIAGVFSTKPGLIGRRSTDPETLRNQIPMAVVGIVPVKVNAENGPIRPRDLLVTSSTPGYAMKGTDRARMLGAVVGKALGSLESGSGVIEVLVSLQ